MRKNIGNIFKTFSLIWLSAYSFNGYAQDAAPEPQAATGLIPQVLKRIMPSGTATPTVQYNAETIIAVSSGDSGQPVQFTVLQIGSIPYCSIKPDAINSIRVKGLAAGVGKCTLLVNQAGNANYAPAPELKIDVTVTQAPQFIVIESVANNALKAGVPAFVRMISGESGNPVAFLTSSQCSISLEDPATGLLKILPKAVGNCYVSATQAGNTNYAKGVLTNYIYAKVSKGDSSLEIVAPDSLQYKTPLALQFNRQGSTGALTVGIMDTNPTDPVCRYDQASKALITFKTGVCTVRASLAGDLNYAEVVTTKNIQIVKAAPSKLVLSGINSLEVSSVADLIVTPGGAGTRVELENRTPGTCQLEGVRVLGISGGKCTIRATQDEDINYLPALPIEYSFMIDKKKQEIKLQLLPNLRVGREVNLSVVPTDSYLPVYFQAEADGDICSVIGNTVRGLRAGICKITATKPGNNYFMDAEPFPFTMSVEKGEQNIRINSVDTLGRGGLATISATSEQPGSIPILFTVAPHEVCVLEGNQIRGVGLGICTISATQAGDANYSQSTVTKQVTIEKGAPVLRFGALPQPRVNVAEQLVPVSSTYSGTPIILSAGPAAVCALDATGKLLVGLTAGDCIVKANQAGDDQYYAATEISATLRVLLGALYIQFPSIGPVALSDGYVDLVASTSAKPSDGLVVNFASTTPTVCSVNGKVLNLLKVGVCTVLASHPGDNNYLSANSVAQDIVILPPVAVVNLTSSANPAKIRSNLSFTANVVGNAVTGTVSFLADGQTIANCDAIPLVAGTATCVTNKLKAGRRQIVANYSGNANNQGSQSEPLSQEIRSLDWLPPVLNLLLTN